MGNNTQQEGSLQELQPSKQPQPQVVVTPPSAIHQADPGAPAKTVPGQPNPDGSMPSPENHFVTGLPPVDPFSHPARFVPSLFNAILATALFRCWNLIILYTGWAACVVLITDKVHDMSIQPTLLTVFGTVLGFVISYRTSSSFERYNEGRRLWSAIVLASRTFSRTVWFHIPDTPSTAKPEDAAEARARNLIEKRTAINLVEAFSVAVKHYLRGEEGIYYEDLYHLVKFLPAYSLPAGMPNPQLQSRSSAEMTDRTVTEGDKHPKGSWRSSTSFQLPTSNRDVRAAVKLPTVQEKNASVSSPADPRSRRSTSTRRTGSSFLRVTGPHGEVELAPASNPPRWGAFDVWPLTMIGNMLIRAGRKISGKKGAKDKAKKNIISHNIPLEITLYLSAYISALQQRKVIDVPTINTLLLGLNQLVDSLSGLERVLTTPIPFSYGVHLWTVCLLYVFFLPFQLWKSFGYITIPATSIAAFLFFGFLAAGEEIENPFGYDKNDLNLDHFCENIIHAEMLAITSVPVPDPTEWVFVKDNDCVFGTKGEVHSPEEWVKKGERAMRSALERAPHLNSSKP